MFSLSQYIYHILFIISSLTLSTLLLVFSPAELPYHGIVLGGASRRLVKFSPPYGQELKGPGKGEVMQCDLFSLFLEEDGPTPFKIISMCKSLLYSLHSLVLWVFPLALFVISSQTFIAETCFLLCNGVYPFCLFHVHARKIKLSVFEM